MVRLRTRNYNRHLLVSLVLGICGLAVLVIALPSWILWALFGTGLLTGALIMLLGKR